MIHNLLNYVHLCFCHASPPVIYIIDYSCYCCCVGGQWNNCNFAFPVFTLVGINANNNNSNNDIVWCKNNLFTIEMKWGWRDEKMTCPTFVMNILPATHIYMTHTWFYDDNDAVVICRSVSLSYKPHFIRVFVTNGAFTPFSIVDVNKIIIYLNFSISSPLS